MYDAITIKAKHEQGGSMIQILGASSKFSENTYIFLIFEGHFCNFLKFRMVKKCKK